MSFRAESRKRVVYNHHTDENVQVELKDAASTYSTLKMRWKNGDVTEKRKVNMPAK